MEPPRQFLGLSPFFGGLGDLLIFVPLWIGDKLRRSKNRVGAASGGGKKSVREKPYSVLVVSSPAPHDLSGLRRLSLGLDGTTVDGAGAKSPEKHATSGDWVVSDLARWGRVLNLEDISMIYWR